MDEIRDYSQLLQRLVDSRSSFVNDQNMHEFAYERSYKNPIDKRPIHVFTSTVDGRAVHLEDDGRLYTSFGPTDTSQDTAAPRERGELSDNMRQLIRLRGGDESRIDVLDGQPAPAQPTFEPRVDANAPAIDVDQPATAAQHFGEPLPNTATPDTETSE